MVINILERRDLGSETMLTEICGSHLFSDVPGAVTYSQYSEIIFFVLALSLEAMIEPAKYGILHQEKSYVHWRDTEMLFLQ